MNNLNKDIEKLKGLIEYANIEDVDLSDCLSREYIQSTENVLSEFETLREISGGLINDNANLKEKLQTYKDIIGEIIEEIRNGMKQLYVDTCVKDEGKYEAYRDVMYILEKSKIIDEVKK